MKDDGVKRDRELSPVVKKGPGICDNGPRESLGSFSEEPLPLLPHHSLNLNLSTVLPST